MSSPPPLLDPVTDDSQFHRLLIDDLIEIGAAVMRGIHQKANANRAAGNRNLADLFEGFEQVSRAIRRGIIMSTRSTTPPETDAAPRLAARKRLIRQIEAAIDGANQRSEEEKRLIELAEQADSLDPDDEDDEDEEDYDEEDPNDEIPDVPFPMILAEICRDLGRASTHVSTRAWRRHVPADALALCARAARSAPPQERH